jgi:aryl-alcohol dehydrogenase-like predicted oxidoreductase
VDRSLRRLGTDHLDVMLLHSCDLEVLRQGEALGALARAREAGKIRFAGYSGDNEAATFAVGLAGVDVIMCSASICDQVNLEGVLPAAAVAGTAVIAKRSVANAAWKPLEAQSGLYRDYAKAYAERFRAMDLKPRDLGFPGAEAWMEIALRFTLAESRVHVLSIGTTSPANAEANLAMLEAGPLPAAAVAKIRQAFREARSRSGGPWPALT